MDGEDVELNLIKLMSLSFQRGITQVSLLLHFSFATDLVNGVNVALNLQR